MFLGFTTFSFDVYSFLGIVTVFTGYSRLLHFSAGLSILMLVDVHVSLAGFAQLLGFCRQDFCRACRQDICCVSRKDVCCVSPPHSPHRDGSEAAALVWRILGDCLGRPKMSHPLTQKMSCLQVPDVVSADAPTSGSHHPHPIRNTSIS